MTGKYSMPSTPSSPKYRSSSRAVRYDEAIERLEALGWEVDYKSTAGEPAICTHPRHPQFLIKISSDDGWREYALECVCRHKDGFKPENRRWLRVHSLVHYPDGWYLAVIERLYPHGLKTWGSPEHAPKGAITGSSWRRLYQWLEKYEEFSWDLHSGNFMVRRGPRGGNLGLVCIDPLYLEDPF